MSPEILARVESWAIAATALSLLGILLGAGVGWRFGLGRGLVAGLLAFAAPWGVAAARAAWVGAGLVAYAVAGFALVPACAAVVVWAADLGRRRRDDEAPPARPSTAARATIRAGTFLFLASFAPLVASNWLSVSAAGAGAWTFLALAGACVVLAVGYLAARAPRFMWVTLLMTGLGMAYFGGLALAIDRVPFGP